MNIISGANTVANKCGDCYNSSLRPSVLSLVSWWQTDHYTPFSTTPGKRTVPLSWRAVMWLVLCCLSCQSGPHSGVDGFIGSGAVERSFALENRRRKKYIHLHSLLSPTLFFFSLCLLICLYSICPPLSVCLFVSFTSLSLCLIPSLHLSLYFSPCFFLSRSLSERD